MTCEPVTAGLDILRTSKSANAMNDSIKHCVVYCVQSVFLCSAAASGFIEVYKFAFRSISPAILVVLDGAFLHTSVLQS